MVIVTPPTSLYIESPQGIWHHSLPSCRAVNLTASNQLDDLSINLTTCQSTINQLDQPSINLIDQDGPHHPRRQARQEGERDPPPDPEEEQCGIREEQAEEHPGSDR
ncbi:hypothetical protein MRV_0129 [Murine roseolovirus]|uniref:Uncharacterized protein n=1 Tax=Murid betaherpesvirus 3 TaxID=2560603 RepID=A0A1P8VJ10_9BETA|nr:hypothetical protein MRV_0001 [Murine roseolovirus]YP_009344956.1 hypothetical protein MRV_0129 [Murine roseolovirus]APZ76212.1 hypothetical protein MRV_0001 [Murid betaherpesvirus 3]APZ76340.1 hypothetical protein MRV_0129 [Murid betaherpesvirus 3]